MSENMRDIIARITGQLKTDLLATLLSKRVIIGVATIAVLFYLHATVNPWVLGFVAGIVAVVIYGDSIRPITDKIKDWHDEATSG